MASSKVVFDDDIREGEVVFSSSEFDEWLGSGKVLVLEVQATKASGQFTVQAQHSISGRDRSYTTFWTPWSNADLSAGRLDDIQLTSLEHGGRVRLRISLSGQGASAEVRILAEVQDA